MVTFQEYLNNRYPNKDVEFFEYKCWEWEGGICSMKQRLEGGELILIDWPKLRYLSFGKRPKPSTNRLTKLEIVNCPNINIKNNNLTSCDFLNSLPNPEKLLILDICDNNIQPTDIEMLSKFSGVNFGGFSRPLLY